MFRTPFYTERMRFDVKTALHLLLVILACGVLMSCTAERPEGFAFKIAVAEDGRVRVAFDDLGYSGPQPESSQLSLTERGEAVTFEVDDGGDGRFGPGDSLTFPGQHLHGEHSWFDPWSDENIYLLRWSDDPASTESRAEAPSPSPDADENIVTRHVEQEEIRVALPESLEGERETWYWRRLSHLDREPFELPLPDGRSPVGLRVALAGLSADAAAAASGTPQHRVDLLLNGNVIASEEWNGQDSVEITADIVAPGSAEPAIRLELRVPQRHLPGQPAALIDAVLLNWIEIDFAGPGSGAGGEVRAPKSIKVFREPGLRAETESTDYLMIAHGSLLEALAPLADFHRQRGLNVTVVDVEDIYNEFNHGIVSPWAIRDFIRDATEHRAAPAPRYVLVVGDASWDVRGEGSRRNLVPSLQVQAHDELAASDNGFVDIRGDDGRPDLAIGRIPAANPAELAAVVTKLLAYAQGDPAASWRTQVALISDASADFQAISNELAADFSGRGLTVKTVYPDAAADTARQDQEQLNQAFDAGQLLVHFLGHGGRFVWRTGPLDYKNSSDLFSIADLERLDNSDRLPLVLSMTCSSGPFDHPEAGSIAEAFLMLPNGGAMGVLAASWRVPASQSFSDLLVGELLKPGQSIGEAILKAKQQEPNPALLESYNFLGDPALELTLPGEGQQIRGNERGVGEQTSEPRPQVAEHPANQQPVAAQQGIQPQVIQSRAARPEVAQTTANVKPNLISWGTASELDSFGYEVFRGVAEDGPFAAINADVIPGGGTTDIPRRYEFTDDTIEPDTTYWYYIESISLKGERKRITPIYPSKPKPVEQPGQ